MKRLAIQILCVVALVIGALMNVAAVIGGAVMVQHIMRWLS